MSHVFISYSHKDKEYVHKLHAALQNEGFEVWIDDRIDYGDKWLKAIEKNLDECDAFIIVMSRNSSESEMVQNEITRARDLEKQIFPLLLDGNNWLVVQSRQFVDVRDGSLPTEKFYKRLETVTQRKNQKAEQEAAEKMAQEKAVRERTEHEAAERARLEAEAQVRKMAAKEKKERQAAEKIANEKVARERQQRADTEYPLRERKKRAFTEQKPMPKNDKPVTKRIPPQELVEKQEPAPANNLPKWKVLIFVALVVVVVSVWALVSAQQQRQQIEPTQSANQGSTSTPKQYSSAPPMLIDVNKQYSAVVKMSNGGEFVIELFPNKAPITVNNFVFLARDDYYNNSTFHRVLDGFMAQGGDPTGTGTGGPGYQFVNEDSGLKFDKAGVVAMANAGRDTNGSQFFITYGPQEYLNGGYTIFGQVVSGMDIVNSITRRDPDQNPDYSGDMIESITIIEK